MTSHHRHEQWHWPLRHLCAPVLWMPDQSHSHYLLSLKKNQAFCLDGPPSSQKGSPLGKKKLRNLQQTLALPASSAECPLWGRRQSSPKCGSRPWLHPQVSECRPAHDWASPRYSAPQRHGQLLPLGLRLERDKGTVDVWPLLWGAAGHCPGYHTGHDHLHTNTTPSAKNQSQAKGLQGAPPQNHPESGDSPRLVPSSLNLI